MFWLAKTRLIENAWKYKIIHNENLYIVFVLEFTYDLDIVIVVQEKILDFQVSELRSRNQ